MQKVSRTITSGRKQRLHKLLELMGKKKDTLKLSQIKALFCFMSGSTPFTVDRYVNLLIEAGMIKVNLEEDKVLAVVEL